MPRDANGNHSLPPGYLAVQGQTVQPSNHNPPLEDISSSLTGSLPRDGSAAMTAPIKLPDGTSSAPAVTFASEPTLGMYRKAAGTLAIAGGVLSGMAPIGLGPLPWTLSTAPAGWVFCKGQTLLRASYPDLWTAAQAEITAGSSFYNTGDGSTTFGVGDCRGRVVAGRDDSSGRLTGFVSMGAAGGTEKTTLARSDLPNVAPTFTGTSGTVNVTSSISNIATGTTIPTHDGAGGAYTSVSNANFVAVSSSGSFTPSGTVASLNGGVTQTAFNNVQPTIATNMILFAGA
jgi:microcystin-dependent protein